MAALERRQTERPILFGVRVAPDTDQALLEQAHDRGQHLRAGQPRLPEIALHAHPDRGKDSAEGKDTVELGLVTNLAVPRVVAVLLAPLRVPTGRLNVSLGGGADPHLRPRRWDHERPDAGQLGLVAHRSAVGVDVAESRSGLHPPDAGARVRDVPEPRGFRGLTQRAASSRAHVRPSRSAAVGAR